MDNDQINPDHYKFQGVELIQVTEQLNFNRGNAVKYIARAGRKDPSTELEDLQKAQWYLTREIGRIAPVEEPDDWFSGVFNDYGDRVDLDPEEGLLEPPNGTIVWSFESEDRSGFTIFDHRTWPGVDEDGYPVEGGLTDAERFDWEMDLATARTEHLGPYTHEEDFA